jgi:cell division inhibitor SepF
VANFLGKLKDIIGGTNQDYQYYEEEMEKMSDQDLHNFYQEVTPTEEEEKVTPPPQTKSRRRNRDQSHFPMDLSPESSLTNSGSSHIPNNVIEMPGVENAINEVVVIEPHCFDEIPQVIKTLRDRRCVILNLNVMDPDEAQRAVDFVAGGTYAIDGHQERIGESIFLFTPKTVKVSTITGGSDPASQSSLNSTRMSISDSLWDDPATAIAK